MLSSVYQASRRMSGLCFALLGCILLLCPLSSAAVYARSHVSFGQGSGVIRPSPNESGSLHRRSSVSRRHRVILQNRRRVRRSETQVDAQSDNFGDFVDLLNFDPRSFIFGDLINKDVHPTTTVITAKSNSDKDFELMEKQMDKEIAEAEKVWEEFVGELNASKSDNQSGSGADEPCSEDDDSGEDDAHYGLSQDHGKHGQSSSSSQSGQTKNPSPSQDATLSVSTSPAQQPDQAEASGKKKEDLEPTKKAQQGDDTQQAAEAAKKAQQQGDLSKAKAEEEQRKKAAADEEQRKERVASEEEERNRKATQEAEDQKKKAEEEQEEQKKKAAAEQAEQEKKAEAEERERKKKEAEDAQKKKQGGASSGGRSGGSDAYSSGSGGSAEVHSGDATYYDVGLGACGLPDKNTEYIVAVSMLLYDSFHSEPGNPNTNEVCGKKIKATYNGKSVVVTVHDRCVGCKLDDLDFSPAAFNELGSQAEGRLHGMSWSFLP